MNNLIRSLFQTGTSKLHDSWYIIRHNSSDKILTLACWWYSTCLIICVTSGSDYGWISNPSVFFICHPACRSCCCQVSVNVQCYCTDCAKFVLSHFSNSFIIDLWTRVEFDCKWGFIIFNCTTVIQNTFFMLLSHQELVISKLSIKITGIPDL